MLSLGTIDKGDYLCINSGYENFDTENLMREHWLTCHKISLTDGFAALVLLDATKEPASRRSNRGRARTVPRCQTLPEWRRYDWTTSSWTHLTLILMLRQ